MLTSDEIQQVLEALRTSPVITRDNHQYADVDYSKDALHHTLGNQPNQAAPGNRTAVIYGGGNGVPNNNAGVNGQYWFRSDTPGTANQRIYVKIAGVWTGIV